MSGRFLGVIVLAGAASFAQTTGNAAGAATTSDAPRTIANPLKAAPTETAAAASPGAEQGGIPEPCVSIKGAKELVGKTGCVSGKVVKVSESRGGNIFVNFCSDYRKCGFSAVSLKRASASVGDLRELEGKVVELRGNITEYNGAAEMQLKRRDQIVVTGEFKNKPQRPYDAVDFKLGGQGRTRHSSFKPRQQHEN